MRPNQVAFEDLALGLGLGESTQASGPKGSGIAWNRA